MNSGRYWDFVNFVCWHLTISYWSWGHITDWTLFFFGLVCCLNVINMISTEIISFTDYTRLFCLLESQHPLLFFITILICKPPCRRVGILRKCASLTCLRWELVSCQLDGILSPVNHNIGAKTNFSLSPIYSSHKSPNHKLPKNHKISPDINSHITKQTQTSKHAEKSLNSKSVHKRYQAGKQARNQNKRTKYWMNQNQQTTNKLTDRTSKKTKDPRLYYVSS